MDRIFQNNKFKILGIVCLVSFVLAFMPAVSQAVDYPGEEYGDFTGTSATTQVGLKTDESQLSFTAPTVVNFALQPDGNFVCPSADNVYIKNNSMIQIKVASFAVTSKSGATGVADVTGQSGNDKYQITVVGNTTAETPFAISSGSGFAGWVLGIDGSATEKCNLTFKNAKMINPTGSKWHDGAALQEVVWTVTSNV